MNEHKKIYTVNYKLLMIIVAVLLFNLSPYVKAIPDQKIADMNPILPVIVTNMEEPIPNYLLPQFKDLKYIPLHDIDYTDPYYIKYYKYFYNEVGKLITVVGMDLNDQQKSIDNFLYSNTSGKIDKVKHQPIADGSWCLSINTNYKYIYNPQGQLIKVQIGFYRNILFFYEIIYNQQGQLKNIKYFAYNGVEEGILCNNYEYIYNQQEQLLVIKSYDVYKKEGFIYQNYYDKGLLNNILKYDYNYKYIGNYTNT